jgi:hypothetical protein
MSFWIHTLPILPWQCSRFEGVIRDADTIRLRGSANSGMIDLQSFEAKLLDSYAGFEVQPSERGISVALLDQSGTPWIWNGSAWAQQPTGANPPYNTPDQIRAGLPSWKLPLKIRLKLQRLDNISPLLKEIKFGCSSLYNNPLSYLFNFGIAQFLSTPPIILNRWLEAPDDEVEGINPDLVLSRNTTQFDGRYLAGIDYQVPFLSIGNNEFYQLQDIPCVLLQLQETENHHQISEVDSIRISPSQSKLLSFNRAFDQRFSVTVVGYSVDDVESIATSIISKVDQYGAVDAPPFGIRYGVRYSQDLDWERSSSLGDNLESGQLQSATFTLTLVSIPGRPQEAIAQNIIGMDSAQMKPLFIGVTK